jgi:hypothetical protein
MTTITRKMNQETPPTRVCEQEGVVVVTWWLLQVKK